MIRHRFRQHRSGSALVTTMLVLTVLTIIVIAFLQSMTVEHKTARSYLNRSKAELAAQAGVEEMLGVLRETDNDTFSITQTNFSTKPTDAPPYSFITEVTQTGTGGATVQYTPLVSGGNPNIPPKKMGEFPTQEELFDQAGDNDASTREPRLPSYEQSYYGNKTPETRWVYLKDTKDRNISRYCYWVEDLQGFLDLTVVGNEKGSGNAQLRGAELGGSKQVPEIAPFTLFKKNLKDDDGSTDAKMLLEKRGELFTGSTLKQITQTIDPSEMTATEPLLYFYYNLGFENNEPEIIPPGFGFVNAGQPKIALNDTIAKPDAVKTLSDTISTNLPQFATERAGGMDPAVYLNNLAASIIDYADKDSQSTTDGATYRGMDSYPLVDQWFMMTAYTELSATGATFVNHHYIEVWNMSDKAISGTIRFEPTNGYIVSVGGSQLDFSQPPTEKSMPDVAVTLQPNEKKVLDIGTATYKVETSSLPSKTVSASLSYKLAYKMYWQDQSVGPFTLVDRSGNPGGAYGATKSFTYNKSAPPNSDTDWNSYISGLIYRSFPDSSDFLDGSIGDPRSAYYLQNVQDTSAYETRAVVGGRTIRVGLTGNTYGEVKPSYWPDPGFDDVPGRAIGSLSKTPLSVTTQASRPDFAMAHFGNYSDSRYRSITELGHVYDFGQWKQYANQEHTTTITTVVQKGLSDITSAAMKDKQFGGGYTLRIGRPEFTRFDNPTSDPYTEKARAAALLGIFSTEATRSTRGLVNINTAKRDVLRALATGITMSSPTYDTPAYTSFSTPAKIYGPVSDPTNRVEADAFADAVIANRPFYSQHELASRLKVTAGGASQLFWGNPNTWHASEKPTLWRDAAAEEYLRQIYDLTTVRSRNFRIHVTGQALDRNGNPTATSRRIVDVYLQPNRNPGDPNKIDGFTVKHLYEISD